MLIQKYMEDITNTSSASSCDEKVPLYIIDIINHFKDISFSSFIFWRGMTCIISRKNLFESITLAVLVPPCTLNNLYDMLNKEGIKYKLTRTYLKIWFPSMKRKTKKKLAICTIMSEFDIIENKQRELYEAILQASKNLEMAIAINKKIRLELKKSQDYQDRLL